MSDSRDSNNKGSKKGIGAGPSNSGGAPPKDLRKLFERQFKKARQAKSHLLPASDVLQILLRNSKSELSDGFTRFKLEQQWESVVGPAIAKETAPCAFERGTLHVWVRSSSWMQQLWFFQDAIRDKTNAFLGREWAKQIRFTLSRRASVEVEKEAGAE